jgi:ankyrin repeat protein
MKHLLLTTIAAVVLVGCGPSVDIHQAAREGSIEAVKQHITTGTDVDAKDNDGSTPLHKAALQGRKDIAELLIAKGADVNAKDNLTSTALHWAAAGGHKEVVELLIAEAAQSEPPTAKAPVISTYFTIHDAAAIGNIEAVKQHLAAETNVNTKDNKGDQTPLHYASVMGHKEIVELLIDNGADVNLKCSTGDTPLDWAMNFNHTETADLLRKHGGKTGEELKAEGN